MKKKKQTMMNEFLLRHQEILTCPYCKGILYTFDQGLVCDQDHFIDISKKGTLMLYKTSKLKKDEVYTKTLFENRRAFIQHGYYEAVYNHIKDYFIDQSLWIDMGCGEGTHAYEMMKEHHLEVLGFDLSKDAIMMASDYLEAGFYPIIADLAQIPLVDDCVDGILNFLSPSNDFEMNRVLKDDGVLIKVVPNKDYLVELRDALGLSSFEEKEYQLKHFECVEMIDIKKTHKLSKDALKSLLHMTPLTQHHSKDISIDTITIDLKVMIYKKKEGVSY